MGSSRIRGAADSDVHVPHASGEDTDGRMAELCSVVLAQMEGDCGPAARAFQAGEGKAENADRATHSEPR